MKLLILGDVVAKPGRQAVLERIQDLREQYAIDLAIMNAENVAGGFSITPVLAEELFSEGIDVMTSGNHIFDKKEAVSYIAKGGHGLVSGWACLCGSGNSYSCADGGPESLAEWYCLLNRHWYDGKLFWRNWNEQDRHHSEVYQRSRKKSGPGYWRCTYLCSGSGRG